MRSSTSASKAAAAAAVLLAALLPPLLGWAALPAASGAARHPGYDHHAPDYHCTDAEVVFIGNSKVVTDIDIDTVRETIGDPTLRTSVVRIGSATMPVYYAALENSVFGLGCTPRVVVVYATRVEALAYTIPPDRRALLLRPYLMADEPVIERKLYGRQTGWAALRERAVQRRDYTLHAVAAWAAGVVWQGDTPGDVRLDAAMARVFPTDWTPSGAAATDAVPVGARPSSNLVADSVDDTFLREVTALVHEHGAQLLVAEAPVSGGILATETERLVGHEAVLEAARAVPDAWVVLPMPSSDPENWGDAEHLSRAAAGPNTVPIARKLGELLGR